MKNALLFRFMLMCSVILCIMTLVSILQYLLWSREQSLDQRSLSAAGAVGVIRGEAERMLAQHGDDATLNVKIAALEEALDLRLFVVGINLSERSLTDMNQVEELRPHRQDLMRMALGQSVLRKRLSESPGQMFYCAPLMHDGEAVGAVAALVRLDAVDTLQHSGQFFVLFMSFGGALVALCFIGMYAQRFLRPISDLETAVVKLSAGENPGDVFSTGNHEISSIVNIFNYMQRNFVEAEAARREFLAGVSHDLRSPLTSIYGYIKAMRDGIIGAEDYPKTLDIVIREVQLLIKLTGDVLESAKIEYGRLKLFKEYVSLGKMMHEIVESMNAYEAIQKRVICEQEVVIYGDASRLKQVFTNLINNACKYNRPDGSVTVTVTRRGAWGVVSVTDTGYGVQEKDRAHIFEKFYRADKSRNREKEGSGLGLFITKRLVDLHQGRITLTSVVGEGSTMTVELPA